MNNAIESERSSGTPEPNIGDDLRKYIATIFHWSWLLVLCMVLSVMVTFIISQFVMEPVYRASTTLLISEASANRTTDYNAILSSERLTRTYSQLLVKRPVLEEVIQRLKLTTTLEKLQKAVDVAPVRDTQLIDVRVENTDPAQAANIANTIAGVFIQQNARIEASRFAASKQSLETQLALIDSQIATSSQTLDAIRNDPTKQGEYERGSTALAQYRQTYANLLQSYEQIRMAEAQATPNIVQVELAAAPIKPVRPNVLLNVVLAAVIGLAVSASVVLLMEALDNTVKDSSDLEKLGLSVLGVIIHYSLKGDRPITILQPRAPVSEAFRTLRTNVQFASVDRPVQVLLVTSPMAGDGKTTVAVNLAVVLAQSGKKVLLLDADLRRSSLSQRLDLRNRAGLSRLFLQSELMLDEILQQSSVPNLTVVTSGTLPPNPAELLSSEKMGAIIQKFKEQFEIIVIDAPPIAAVADALALAQRADGVLLVTRQGKTQVSTSRQTVDALNRLGVKLIGVVLNNVRTGIASYGYYYDYHYEHGSGKVKSQSSS